MNLGLELPEDKKNMFCFKNSVIKSINSESSLKYSYDKENIQVSSFNFEQENKDNKEKISIKSEERKKSLKLPSERKFIEIEREKGSLYQINQTIILENSYNFFNSFVFNQNDKKIEIEELNPDLYILEAEKTINKIQKEAEIWTRNKTKSIDETSIFLKKLKKITFNFLNEERLINKELLKKTLDKLDSEYLPPLLFFQLISLKITKYEEKFAGGYIVYTVELNDKIINKIWTFKCRYSKLRYLYLETKFALALEGKNVELKEFPARKIFGNKDGQFLEERKNKLQNYFDSYLNNKEMKLIMGKGILRSFLFKEICEVIQTEFQEKEKKLEKLDESIEILQEIQKILGNIKKNMDVLKNNETVLLFYYSKKMNKLKAIDMIKSS